MVLGQPLGIFLDRALRDLAEMGQVGRNLLLRELVAVGGGAMRLVDALLALGWGRRILRDHACHGAIRILAHRLLLPIVL